MYNKPVSIEFVTAHSVVIYFDDRLLCHEVSSVLFVDVVVLAWQNVEGST